jgi:hypothetical protein
VKKVYESLREIDSSLRLAILSLTVFFVSGLLENLVTPFWYSIELGVKYIGEFLQFFDFDSLFSILALLAIYIVVADSEFKESIQRQKFLIVASMLIFLFHYVLTFHFVERLLSLYPFSFGASPKNFTDFLPFDWVGLTFDYQTINDGYGGWKEYLSLILNFISAISILIAALFFIKHTKSGTTSISFKPFIKPLQAKLATKRRIVLSVILIIPFLFINSINVQSYDFRVLTYETQFAQEDLTEFYKEFTNASSLEFNQQENAKKAAANKFYPDIVARNARIQSIDNSLLSNDLFELKKELIEWVDLWQVLLQQIALESGGTSETLFKITQKYIEVSRIALANAPARTDEDNIDFWQTEFLTLTK